MSYQQRLTDEKTELDAKLEKLYSFLATDTFNSLDEAEQDRLRLQAEYMTAYSGVLSERLAAIRNTSPDSARPTGQAHENL